jgi:UDP-N-acetylmuramoyl-tripeptide--D-alanyl-D-alanine ligase
MAYTLVTPAGSARIELAVPGRHQVGNTLTAAAVALAAGVPFDQVATGLAELRLVSKRRMDVFERADGITVIDDSYNANPASMSAALHALADLGSGRRRIAVLGYMAELGDYETSGHREVGELAAKLDVDRLIVVGEAARPIRDGAEAMSGWAGTAIMVADQDAAIEALRDHLRRGDVVLVKASRYRTWAVVDALRELDLVEAPGPTLGAPPPPVTSMGGRADPDGVVSDGRA